MKISNTGIKLIKSFEGCYLKAYKCAGGVWTIGWGTTEPINGVRPYEGMIITQQQADELLIKNLKSYEAPVNKYVTYSINQNQFDALVSFAYNCGSGALKTSTLLNYLNQGKIQQAANEFDRWTKAGGKVLKGLVRRRAAEKELFLAEIELPKEDKDLSNAVSKIIKSGVLIEFNAWKRKDLIQLSNVPALLNKLGGVDKLVLEGVISQRVLWDQGTYTVNNARALLIKYAHWLG